MIRPEFSFERFLEIVLPGAIVVLGTWYLHRPFLLVYFPVIAADAATFTEDGTGLGVRTFVLVLAMVLVGVGISNLSDVVVAALVEDESDSDKSSRIIRRAVRRVFTICFMGRSRDPRVYAIERYLASPRRQDFLRVVRDWCFSNEERLCASKAESVAVHQHLVVRMKAIGLDGRALISEAVNSVKVSSGVLISFLVLCFVTLLAFPSNGIVESRVAVHGNGVILTVALGAFLGAFVTGYVLRRALHHFASYAITLSIHLYACVQRTSNK